MKIVCDSCGAKYSIADEKVAGKIFKIRCKKCSSVLEVRGDQTNANAADQAIATSDRGGEATWYIVVDGEQKGPLAPIGLSQLFAKGSVGLESYVWNEGFDDWRVASDVPEIAQLFGCRRHLGVWCRWRSVRQQRWPRAHQRDRHEQQHVCGF